MKKLLVYNTYISEENFLCDLNFEHTTNLVYEYKRIIGYKYSKN